ncbi:MAG: flagellar motor switch protein FliM [Vicinamibacterales bacterium]
MGKILSQEEIDALLNSAGQIQAEQAPSPEIPAQAGAITYNFRRPDRVSKDQIRSLHFLHDRFARNVATSLSAFLRAVSDVSIVSVEQFAYSEFLMSLPDPTAFYAIHAEPQDILCALEVNPAVAFTMVDRLLGGSGQGASTLHRALTEIEQNVVDSVVKLVLDNLNEAWRAMVEIDFTIQNRETRPQMMSVAAPNEVVVLVVFDVRIGETRGMMNLCIPAALIESSGASFVQGWHRTRKEPTVADRTRLRESLRRVRLPVAARLETVMPARELLELRAGDIISLGRPLRDPVNVWVGDTPKMLGRLVRNDERAAVAVLDGVRPPLDTGQRLLQESNAHVADASLV